MFVMYSTADTHWQKLHVLIEQQRQIATGVSVDLSTLSTVEQRRRRVKNLIEYPHLAASFLQKRFLLFLKHVLQRDKKMKLRDHWFRFEWQF